MKRRDGRCDTCLCRRHVRVVDRGNGWYQVLCDDCRTVEMFASARQAAPIVLKHTEGPTVEAREPVSLELFT